MGNGGSRDAGDVATLRQGLELIGRWALLLARKSPQMIDRWEQLEERLQTAEAEIEVLQDNMGRVTERLARLEDREKARETRVATLETSIEKALSTMFPRVDALLTHLEQQNNSNGNKGTSILKEDHLEITAVPVNTSGKSTDVAAPDVCSPGGKRKRQQKGRKEQAIRTSASEPPLCSAPQISPSPAKKLATGMKIPVSTTPSTSTTPDASPTPSTSSTSSSPHREDLEDSLLNAVVSGRVRDLRCLVAEGADVNVVNIYGQTPVALAASRGHTDCLSTLLFAGGAVNGGDRDLEGYLPVHAAAMEGQVASLNLLISAGADINVRTEPTACTPLMLAVSQGHHDFVSVLLQNDADVNIQDDSGETGLHKAVMAGSRQSVSLLLDAGADVNVVDKSGFSPLHRAHQLQRKQIRKMLISARARKIS